MSTLLFQRRLKALLLFTLCAASLTLSACGRNSAPTPPGPSDKVTYPRTYPAE